MDRLIILICLLFVINLTFSQKQGEALIDSLEQELPKIKADTSRLNCILKIGRAYYPIDRNKSLAYGKMGLPLAEASKIKKYIADFNNLVGVSYSDLGKDSLALIHLNKSLTINTEIGDAANFNRMSNLSNIGRVYHFKSNHTKAISYFYQALKLAEQENDAFQISKVCENMIPIFVQQNDTANTKKYAELLMLNAQKTNDEGRMATAHRFLGRFYLDVHDFKKAEDEYKQALAINTKIDDRLNICFLYGDLAYLYDEMANPILALQCNLHAYNLIGLDESEDMSTVGNMEEIGEHYLEIVQNDSIFQEKNKLRKTSKNELLDSALFYLKISEKYCLKHNYLLILSDVYQNLADVYAIKGDYKKAYLNFKDFFSIYNSLFSQENKNKIATIDGNYQLSLKDKEIQLNQLTIASQKKQLLFFIVGLILISAIGLLLFRQSKIRKKTNATLLHLNSELDEANKIKAKFFAIISHDLRSPIANLVSFLNLQKDHPTVLTEEAAAKHQQHITQTAEDLLETMESMLLWSKGQMETFKPSKKQIEVDDLFLYIQKYFANINHVQFNFSNPQKLTVFSDEYYLKTIMHNLTANAIKALKDKPNATIEWSCYQKDNQIVLCIQDNGTGANIDHLKALFEEHSTLNTKTGLGLHIIRDLAKAINCVIKMETQNNVGTSFLLTI